MTSLDKSVFPFCQSFSSALGARLCERKKYTCFHNNLVFLLQLRGGETAPQHKSHESALNTVTYCTAALQNVVY